MLEDLLKSVLEGAVQQQQPQRRQTSSDPLQDILGGILGGGSSSQGSGGLGDLLEGILGGGSSSQSSGGLGDLLEGILGGGAQQQPAAPGRGTTPQGGLGLEDILGSILGGSGASSNSFLAPIIEMLAERLGLPPAIAQMVVSFVLGKLLSGGASQAQVPQPSPRAVPSPASPQGFDLDHLLERMGSEQGLGADYLMSTGVPNELAQQTGLDPDTAARSMQEVLNMMLGSQVAARQPRQIRQPEPGSLDDLLDTW